MTFKDAWLLFRESAEDLNKLSCKLNVNGDS